MRSIYTECYKAIVIKCTCIRYEGIFDNTAIHKMTGFPIMQFGTSGVYMAELSDVSHSVLHNYWGKEDADV